MVINYNKILRGTKNNTNFSRPEGAGNFDNMDDVNIVKSISLLQGTIDHAPVNAKDITNKEYIDSVAVWQPATGGIHYSTGNVGLGTTTPATQLQVIMNPADTGSRGIRVGDATDTAAISLSTDGGGRGIISVRSQGTPKAAIVASGDSYFNGGNVGIGVATPRMPLEVTGNMILNDASPALYFATSASSKFNYKIDNRDTLDNAISISVGQSTATAETDIYYRALSVLSNKNVVMTENVGIGVDAPTEKLEVAGLIESTGGARLGAGATGDASLGSGANSTGTGAAAVGYYPIATGIFATAIGRASATANNTVAVGTYVSAGATSAVAIGSGYNSTNYLANTTANTVEITAGSDKPAITCAAGTLGTAGDVTIGQGLNVVGDLLFTTAGGGLAYGEMYGYDNTTADTFTTATWGQITRFGVNGLSNNTSPDHTNDHITITKAGVYHVNVNVSFSGDGSVEWELGIQINNGATVYNNLHTHRKLGAGGDVGSANIMGVASFAVNDTVELWARQASGVNKDIIVKDVNMNILQVGA